MPGLNRTGPLGNGQMTGRGMGQCRGARSYGAYCGRGIRHSMNYGAGFGRGRGFGFNQNLNYNVQTITPEEEKQFLQEQKEFLKSQLEEIEKQIGEV